MRGQAGIYYLQQVGRAGPTHPAADAPPYRLTLHKGTKNRSLCGLCDLRGEQSWVKLGFGRNFNETWVSHKSSPCAAGTTSACFLMPLRGTAMFLRNASFIGGSSKQEKHMGFRRSGKKIELNGQTI